MNRQQAKELLPIIQAFAEGNTIEFRIKDGEEPNGLRGWEWEEVDIPTFDTRRYEYRIKPETKYRPFANEEECWQEMQKHQPFGWLKDKEDGHYTLITAINKTEVDQIALNGNTGWLFCSISKFYTFADGTPFGIKEE